MKDELDPLNPIEQQLQGERAMALGDAGRRLEAALAELARGGTANAPTTADTEDRVDDAATAAWHYIIVRESLGMFDHQSALRIFGVPNRVMARVGVIKARP